MAHALLRVRIRDREHNNAAEKWNHRPRETDAPGRTQEFSRPWPPRRSSRLRPVVPRKRVEFDWLEVLCSAGRSLSRSLTEVLPVSKISSAVTDARSGEHYFIEILIRLRRRLGQHAADEFNSPLHAVVVRTHRPFEPGNAAASRTSVWRKQHQFSFSMAFSVFAAGALAHDGIDVCSRKAICRNACRNGRRRSLTRMARTREMPIGCRRARSRGTCSVAAFLRNKSRRPQVCLAGPLATFTTNNCGEVS
jgi:hypothetical protein